MWMDQTKCQLKQLTHSPWFEIGIAIPARNEAHSIVACLQALDIAAAAVKKARVTIFVSVNNSSDQTAYNARQFRSEYATLIVEEIDLPNCDAHAGGSRKRAMDQAAMIAGPDGVIMTSDADSEVSPDWIIANLTELSKGADAVAGAVAFKAKDRLQLMPMLLARASEWRLAGLQARLSTLLDPFAA